MDTSIGGRIRRLRSARGLSQVDLAERLGISNSYMSLIESGRRTAPEEMLELIAQHLDSTVDVLRPPPEPASADPDPELELELRFAEMALQSGEAATALERFKKLVVFSRQSGQGHLALDALWGRARALERLGQLEDAVADYEALRTEPTLPGTLDRTTIIIALSRVYNDCGDLGRAIDLGEEALRQLEAADASEPVTGSALEGLVALASTLAGCYYERDDLVRAQALATNALERAERDGSPRARASAAWNAGLIAEARGDLRTARVHVERALGLSREGDNARNIALLKIVSAWVTMRDPDSSLEGASSLLEQALSELEVIGSQVDLAYAQTELARCRLLAGDTGEALDLAQSALDRLGDTHRLEGARALLIIGHARLEDGDEKGGISALRDAAEHLQLSTAKKQSAAVWRELAETLAQLGRADEALAAYHQATEAAGISASPQRVRKSAALGGPGQRRVAPVRSGRSDG